MPGGILFRKMCGDDDALRGQLVRDEYPSLGDHSSIFLREHRVLCESAFVLFPHHVVWLKTGSPNHIFSANDAFPHQLPDK